MLILYPYICAESFQNLHLCIKFLYAFCIAICAEQMLNLSCSYLVQFLRYEYIIVKLALDVKHHGEKMTSNDHFHVSRHNENVKAKIFKIILSLLLLTHFVY